MTDYNSAATDAADASAASAAAAAAAGVEALASGSAANSAAAMAAQSQQQKALAATASPTTFPHLPPLSTQHPLTSAFSFWYLNKKKGGAGGAAGGAGNLADSANYEENIHKMATFHTVEEFWSIYSHLARPNDLPSSINYHLFRAGVAPMWEDPVNAAGGKWVLRIKKGMASRVWEECVLALIGDAFHLGEEVCGIVLVTKGGEDVLSVWNAHAANKDATNRIRDTMRRVLELPPNAPLEYRPHDVAIKNAAAR